MIKDSNPNSNPNLQIKFNFFEILNQLIKTEKIYLNDLIFIIKNLAGVYSIENFPPKHLDHHFRLIESIFRSNQKILLNSLIPFQIHHQKQKQSTHQQHNSSSSNESSNESSHESVIEDFINLLIDWFHQIYPIYLKYCSPNGWAGGGGWNSDQFIKSNQSLIKTLCSIHWPKSLPKPPNEIFPKAPYNHSDLFLKNQNQNQITLHPTLTVHFALPFSRLIFYSQLFNHLLNSLNQNSNSYSKIKSLHSNTCDLLNRGSLQFNFNSNQLLNQIQIQQQHQQLPKQQHHQHHQHQPQQLNHHQNQIHSNPTSSNPSQNLIHQSNHLINHHINHSNSKSIPSNLHQPLIKKISNSSTNHSNLTNSTQSFTNQIENNSSLTSLNDDLFDQTNSSSPTSSSSTPSETKNLTSPSDSQNKNHQLIQISNGIFVQKEILDLENQLDTSQCLDIFTLMPKQCRLHLAPPTLTYSRSFRIVSDANFKFIPQSNPNQQIETLNGRLILLTDLLIFSKYINQNIPTDPPFTLLYPPLATKHLKFIPSNHLNQFQIIIMSRETIHITVENKFQKDHWIQALEESIEFGHQQLNQNQKIQPPSPLNHQIQPNNLITSPIPKLKSLPTSNQFNHRPPSLKKSSSQFDQSRSPISSSSDDQNPQFQSSPHSPPLFIQEPPNIISPCLESFPKGPRLGPPPQNSFNDHHHRSLQSIDSNTYKTHNRKISEGQDSIIRNRNVNPIRPDRQTSRPGGISPSNPHHSTCSMPSPRILRKAPSAHALGKQVQFNGYNMPPLPNQSHLTQSFHLTDDLNPKSARSFTGSDGMLTPSTNSNLIIRPNSTDPCRERHYSRPSITIHPTRSPSRSAASRITQGSSNHDDFYGKSCSEDEESIPESPKSTPITQAILTATMRTKVFLKQSHSQWKSLGQAKLHLFKQVPGNTKQLVVGDDKGKTIISTIILTDGIERVGKTGIAVDLSDKGMRTGIVYMLQMKNEKSASGLFEQFLEGSDRRPNHQNFNNKS
ncbi:hypothetical protein O181_050297 [Austropuccinia psidii MF-1]|uniref:DH domain-containing protein n=1 Tax=Austropuccinia psidii MF-1 TaxID=1389203 RepID=A0A9Q3HNG3_9BASI|nr:hypothetical protein [Austropuccinia psidii MF-1]